MNMADLARGEAAQDARKLSATDELLRWLLRYPFLSAEDLAAALCYSVAQCYRNMAELRGHGWVEAVTVPALGISRAHLYHLTSEGVRIIAEREGVDPIALARYFRADEPHLLALLVRAPALVAVQTLIRATVTQAPVALASEHRPCRVTWSWARDYRLTAVSQEQVDHPLSVILDAYLILQVALADGAAPRQGCQQAGHLSPQPAAAALVPEVVGHVLPAGSRQHMGWYGVLVLYDAGLMPERLMARRLRTLLICREAPDRWAHLSAYPAFPPLLVLTPDAHRAQRWHLVARSVAASAGLDPLRGGVLVMTSQSLAAPWRAGWYAFDGGTAERLADLLIPSTPEALPPVPILQDQRANADTRRVPVIEQACHPGVHPSDTASSHRSHPTGQSPILRPIVGKYNRRAAKQTNGRSCACADQRSAHRSVHSREQRVLASLRLGARYVDVLRLLHEHPLLSRAELAAAIAVDEASAARYLSLLRREGWVSAITAKPFTLGWSASIAARFSQPCRSQGDSALERETRFHEQPRAQSARDRFLVSVEGLRLLAAGARLRVRSLCPAEACVRTRSIGPDARVTARNESLARAYRGCVTEADLRALLRHPAHTAGVYTFFAVLMRAVEHERARDHLSELLWWETGDSCIRRYRSHERWRNFRPDGAGELLVGGIGDRAGGRRFPFWLEWDRGTMGARDLRAKFASYVEYIVSREWRADGYALLPRLLVVTRDATSETGCAEALRNTMSRHSALEVWITTRMALETSGPFAAIWRSWNKPACHEWYPVG